MKYVLLSNDFLFILVVTINFGRSMYPYSENHGEVSDITVVLSNEIAQSLTVTVSGSNDKYITTV